jgi:hypothetical protein
MDLSHYQTAFITPADHVQNTASLVVDEKVVTAVIWPVTTLLNGHSKLILPLATSAHDQFN